MKRSEVPIIHGKWKKTVLCYKHPHFKRLTPPTARFTRSQLATYLNRYGTVYIKPNYGRHGQGVIKAQKTRVDGKTRYSFHHGFTRKTLTTFDQLVHNIRAVAGGQFYVIQKGVRGLTYHGRPFDIRVMVQKSPSGRWETTGKIGRLARRGKIVTNYNRGINGGTPMKVDTLLGPHTTSRRRHEIHGRLNRLGTSMARYMERAAYKHIKAIGLDVVLDSSLKPWIIEVNTAGPNPYLFRHLRDNRVYYKILRYHRHNKRLRGRR